MFAISPTDLNWFHLNKALNNTNKVNFWTPTPWKVRRLNANDRLYFMLKSPVRKIGGFGQFREYKEMTVKNAWIEFGKSNGVPSKAILTEKINSYLKRHTTKNAEINDYEIGCIIIDNCEFWEEDQYVDILDTSHNFSKNIVKIKYFNEFDSIQSNVKSYLRSDDEFELIFNTKKKKKESFSTVRVGQSEFRAKILSAYNFKCSISGESCLELLEAAHIQPYLNEKSNHVQNGILLRIDFHKLLDRGLLAIDREFRILISKKINSHYYKSFQGKKIELPHYKKNYPSIEAIKFKLKEFR